MQSVRFVIKSLLIIILSLALLVVSAVGRDIQPYSQESWSQEPAPLTVPGQSSSGTEIPSFFYIDIEMISGYFSEEAALTSALSVDWYQGYFVLHLGAGGIWFTPEAFIYEAAVGIPISKTYQRNVPVTQVFYEGTEYRGGYAYDRYRVQKGRADMAVLHLIEIGFRGFEPFYVADSNPAWDPVVFGTQYFAVTDIHYYAYDKIIYLGYKYMSLRSRIFTREEIILYIHAMIGYTDRKAEIWDNFSNMSTATSSGDVLFGFDAGIRWHMVHARFGYYDGNWYGGAGFRFGFNTL